MKTSNLQRPSTHSSASIPAITLACALAVFYVAVASPSEAADQFVLVTNPGWTNSSQYSWTGAWGDYDKDGFVDLFVPNGTASGAWTNFLYHNNGDGTFTRKFAEQAGSIASDKDASLGAAWGDVNNDGLLDLIPFNAIWSESSPPVTDQLYINQGNGTFVSVDAGDLTKTFYFGGWGGLADYDNDGWLDAFMMAAGAKSGHRTNVLFHARSDGTFSLVTNSVLATDQTTYSNDAAWGDFDNDGKLDLIVANYQSGRDFFYRNDGHGQFTRLTNSILEKLGYQTFHHAWGDYDNDGFLDLAASTANGTRLFRNNGSGDFVVVTNFTSFGLAVWCDYDNDGYLDLLVCRGQGSPLQLRLFHNNGDGTFKQVEDIFTRPVANWIGGAWGDYDNDGFLDLFVAEQNGKNALYHNQGNANHWIKFKLDGTVANRAAIGAKIRVKATFGGKTFWQMREVSGGSISQNDLRANFGLGDATTIDTVRIEWPSGTVQELHDVKPNQILTVTEPAHLDMARPGELRVQSWKGQQFQIESSVDLIQWTPLSTATNETGALIFTDPTAGSAPRRFYRAHDQ